MPADAPPHSASTHACSQCRFQREPYACRRSQKACSPIRQHARRIHHIRFLLHRTCGKQDILLRNPVAHGKHRLQYGTRSIRTDTTHFTGGSHVHPQHRVRLLQAVERELRSLDSYIIQLKETLLRFFDRKPQHHPGCQLDKVYLQNLAHERKRTAGAKVTLNNLDVIVLCQILDIERAGNVQSLGNLAAETGWSRHRNARRQTRYVR